MNLNATILGQTISFIFFVWFCMKFIWPPVITMIEKRKKEIIDSFNLIKKRKTELLLKENEIKKIIEHAHIKSDEIIKKAYISQNDIIEKAKKKAIKEEQKIMETMNLKLELKYNKINEELQKKTGLLAIIIAEKILKRSINKKDHENLIHQIISKF
ncbi:ATP synthase subunit b [Buchnera aphidicola (Eriosoma grossulariae)]|uniref:F0F1 ATP synthase subunit B n=1 Tax=Buchnera aphidicola TaxID=9 RepID=UPI003464E5AF